ncbi:hypothetical protein [Afifella sp. IM 167]|uniref:hypothetical protein n=1 Tax=Afifella sp. IM 167 TaxID=2033586 RepID=UPI001CCBEB9D|nr:hypothetical protein [Afifella sp. IM 167]
MDDSLKECLAAFNRKERYWLFRAATFGFSKTSNLHKDFRTELNNHLSIKIPKDAWWAIDYHIDWLFAALVLYLRKGNVSSAPFYNPKTHEDKKAIRGSNEDFDLIIAFKKTIILVEAKGLMSWSNEQLQRKCSRLKEWEKFSESVFLEDNSKLHLPSIYIVLTSPRESSRVKKCSWPQYVQPTKSDKRFLTLHLPGAPKEFLAPERCMISPDIKPSKKGTHWRFKRIYVPKTEIPTHNSELTSNETSEAHNEP